MDRRMESDVAYTTGTNITRNAGIINSIIILTLLLPGDFWVNISLQAARFNILKFTIVFHIRGGVSEEEHPSKFSDISNH